MTKYYRKANNLKAVIDTATICIMQTDDQISICKFDSIEPDGDWQELSKDQFDWYIAGLTVAIQNMIKGW